MRLGKVNLLFGENSSGKTSILQLLLLLRQTVKSYDRAQPLNLGSRDSLIDLGVYEDFIYQHDESHSFVFEFAWKAKADESGKWLDASLQVEFEYESETIRVDKTTIQAYDKSGSLLRVKGTDNFFLYIDDELPDIDSARVARPHFAPIKCYGFPPLATQFFPNLNDLSLAVEDFASRMYYLSPVRVSPQRRYIWSGSKPEGVGSHGEAAIQVLLANLIERRALPDRDQDSIPNLIDSIEKWMIRMGLAESFTVTCIHSKEYKVELRVPGMTTMANLADVGVGVSQVLPVLILAHVVPEGSILILEQPESDLHPSAQAELADLFFEFGMKRNIQFIIETHSEYLLTRLQRRVAESDMDVSDDVRL
ncbi:MAG: AAA family ATPase, partial [Tumebacillaceae bacterium]